MRHRDVKKLLLGLRGVLDVVPRSDDEDVTDFIVQAHWAQYGCVAAAGFFERALQILYTAYASQCANEYVASFVRSSFRNLPNPKFERFVAVAKSFNPTWADELNQHPDREVWSNALGTLMTHRHKIAHGHATIITVARVRNHVDDALGMLELIENQLGLA